ncbi:TIGR03089 family protein [Arthrobacter sp. H5]|uniref:TIGR03089 family protein n=1 Tax=Arthrobacter sp. H5 TaxID=1267973 RepID=UPI00048708A8|nr:TIGR03089 family protein [Arthrobacter sp. H5]
MQAIQGITGLLERLRTHESSSPRLVWYGGEGERIELSGRVLDNWVAKTSNLLVEELDAEQSTRVGLRLPPHWKTLVWAMASWQVGAVTVIGERSGEVDISGPVDIDVTGPGSVPDEDAPARVLVAPGAMDLRWPGELPPGALDYAAVVRSFGDVYLDDVPADNLPLMEADRATMGFQDLPASDGGVLLVSAGLHLRAVLEAALSTWSADGTLIVVHPDIEVSDKLLAGERVTARLEA